MDEHQPSDSELQGHVASWGLYGAGGMAEWYSLQAHVLKVSRTLPLNLPEDGSSLDVGAIFATTTMLGAPITLSTWTGSEWLEIEVISGSVDPRVLSDLAEALSGVEEAVSAANMEALVALVAPSANG